MSGHQDIFGNFLEALSIQGGQRVLHPVQRAVLQGGVNIAQSHGNRRSAQGVEALHVYLAVRQADFLALDIRRRHHLGLGHQLALAVHPVAGQHRQTFVSQFPTFCLVPVAVDQLPHLVPVVEEERPVEDSQIRHAVVRIECAVCDGDDALSHDHLVDQLALASKGAVGEQFQLHGPAALSRQKLGPLFNRLADGFLGGILKSDLDGDHIPGGRRRLLRAFLGLLRSLLRLGRLSRRRRGS